MNPTNLSEWIEYIDALPAQEIYRKANLANQLGFVDTLREEGFSAKEITAIFKRFGERLLEIGSELPGRADDSYLDYGMLLDQSKMLDSVEVE